MAEMRRHLHFLVADLLYYSGLLAIWRFLRTRLLARDQICVFGLHRVLTEAEFARSNSLPGMVMKEATFAGLLEHVTRHYRVLALGALLNTEGDGSGPCCALTFDDGWRDNYTRAYPWLGKYEVPATTFLATGYIGSEDVFWVERLAGAWRDRDARRKIQLLAGCRWGFAGTAPGLERVIGYLKRMPAHEREQLLKPLLPGNPDTPVVDSPDRMLSWDEVMEMHRAGFDFGAHTVTHMLLTYEDETTIERELREAKLVLEQKLGKRIGAFAYPNGDYNSNLQGRVAAAGYDCAFTTRQGWFRRGQDLYAIPRVLLHEGNVTGRGGKFSPAMFTFTLACFSWRP